MFEGFGLMIAAIALVKFTSLMFKEAGSKYSRKTKKVLWENEFYRETALKFNSCKGYQLYVSNQAYNKKTSEYEAGVKVWGEKPEWIYAKTEEELVAKVNSRLEELKALPNMKRS